MPEKEILITRSTVTNKPSQAKPNQALNVNSVGRSS